MSAEQAWSRRADGFPKLIVTHRALELRKRSPQLFGPDSSYQRLPVTGQKKDHLVAFARGGGAAVLAPRLVARLGGDWATAVDLGRRRWHDLLSDRDFHAETAVGDILNRFPVAILEVQD